MVAEKDLKVALQEQVDVTGKVLSDIKNFMEGRERPNSYFKELV